ncbi:MULTISPECIES: hypothetical protein [unclassified Streptomyces]|uniref:hypothetical protein n=1 Tax=unclassified Streptomyces TaxID=2593676 RepID=UPI00081D4D7C|nr:MULTISPECIES: hypothetical protein [unclassified Streptomyces]MYZ37502.1 hypothetical protein [Streptomyces sp. SID4917]SCF91821.1 hypothetical protein GA0115259_104828 [Streptomyces sp. MnatMP-M17]
MTAPALSTAVPVPAPAGAGTARPRPLPDHGTLSRHKYHGCKCPACVEHYLAYQRARHRKRGYGTWQPYVDAEPIRQHLLALNAAGLSYAVIAERIGRATATVTGFIYDASPRRPRKKRATPEIAAAILAVTAAEVMPGQVDSTGTGRRVQALAAIGWPMRTLGPHIGTHPACVGRLAGQRYVLRSTARMVADAYENLQHQRPEEHGVSLATAVKTRKWAARQGWPDPVWWDDMGRIDDPTFDPKSAERDLNRDQLAALRRTEIDHLRGFGLTDETIAVRLGLALSTVHAITVELRTGQRRDRAQTAKEAA